MKNTLFRKTAVIIAIVSLSFAGISFVHATVPPVSGFSASLSGTTATVSWTTPNDGTLSQFDLRYASSPINEGNFYLASQVATMPQPLPGQTQSVQVPGLSSGTTYFAILVTNIFAENSPIVTTSVSTSGGSTGGSGGAGCSSPFSVMNFQAMPISSSIINVSWSTPSQGDLSQFDLRYASSPINEGNFYLASQVATMPQPLPGQTQSVQVSGLSANTLYYFSIKVTNICALSSPSVTTSATTLAGGGGGGSTGGGGGGSTGGGGGGSTGGGGGGSTQQPTYSGGGGGYLDPIALVSNPRVIINNGEEKTYSTNVTLTLLANNASQMKISNLADVSDASWQPYTDKKSWTLTSGDGIKTVYVKYRNSNNIESKIVSDNIRLGDEPPAPQPEAPKNTTTTQIIYIPIARPEGQVLGVSTYRAPFDFNTLMVNWGENKAGNYADLNKDGSVNMKDVQMLMKNWVNISSNDVYVPLDETTKFIIEPSKLTLVEGQEVTLVVNIVPNGREKNYTANLELYYPTDVLEYKSFTYWKNWIPVIRPDYDVVDEVRGRIVKTAGMPEGFDSKRVFGVIKFIAKKTGSGSVNIENDSYSLNASNIDMFGGASEMKKSIVLDTVKAPSGTLYQFASLISFGETGNLAAFVATFIFFLIVYIIYFFWGGKRKKTE